MRCPDDFLWLATPILIERGNGRRFDHFSALPKRVVTPSDAAYVNEPPGTR
jgi:hypothetical protein